MRGTLLLLLCLLGCSPEQEAELTAHILILSGDSNMKGNQTGSVPAGIPLSVTLLPTWIAHVDGTPNPDPSAFHDLDVNSVDDTHGPELTLGLQFHAAGLRGALGKFYRGSSSIDQWLSGGPFYTPFITTLTAFADAVDVKYPSEPVVYHWIDYRGVTEVQSANPNASENFGARMVTLRNEIAAVVGQTPLVHCVLTHAGTTGANVPVNLPVLRATQIANSNFQIYVDDLALQGDNVHLTPASENTLGERILNSLHGEISPSRSAGNVRFSRRNGRRP